MAIIDYYWNIYKVGLFIAIAIIRNQQKEHYLSGDRESRDQYGNVFLIMHRTVFVNAFRILIKAWDNWQVCTLFV